MDNEPQAFESKEVITFDEFKAWLTGLIVGKRGALPDLEDWKQIKKMMDKVVPETIIEEREVFKDFPFPSDPQPWKSPITPMIPASPPVTPDPYVPWTPTNPYAPNPWMERTGAPWDGPNTTDRFIWTTSDSTSVKIPDGVTSVSVGGVDQYSSGSISNVNVTSEMINNGVSAPLSVSSGHVSVSYDGESEENLNINFNVDWDTKQLDMFEPNDFVPASLKEAKFNEHDYETAFKKLFLGEFNGSEESTSSKKKAK